MASEGAEVIKDSLISLSHPENLLSAYNGLGTHYDRVTCSTREPSPCLSWISYTSEGRQTIDQNTHTHTQMQNINMLGKSLGFYLYGLHSLFPFSWGSLSCTSCCSINQFSNSLKIISYILPSFSVCKMECEFILC